MKDNTQTNPFLIQERLTNDQLLREIAILDMKYKGTLYKHKNGGLYEVQHVVVVNDNGQAEWGFVYCPLAENGEHVHRNIAHVRKLSEFLDGRFTIINPFRIDHLDLSVRAYNVLVRAGFLYVKQIEKISDERLQSLRNMNKKAFEEIRAKVPYEGERNDDTIQPT